jgi:hypothetical protein
MYRFSRFDISKSNVSRIIGLVGETLDSAIPVAPQMGEVAVKIVTKLNINYIEMKSEAEHSRRSPLTESIKKANAECDATLNDIKRSAKTGEQSTIPVKADAGKTLVFFLEPFWNLNKEPLASQIKLTDELLLRYNNQPPLQAAAQMLNFSELFPTLGQQNTTLDTLYNQRMNEQIAESPAASRLRGGIAEGYNGFSDIVVKTVNQEQAPPAIVELFNQMDYLRKKYSALTPSHIDIALAVTEPIATQIRTGKAITPIPVAFYEGTELTFAKDFSLTYKNNIEVGVATVILHGKGRFTGSNERKFNIITNITN